MKNSKIKPILAGTALIIPIIALMASSDAQAKTTFKNVGTKITSTLGKLPKLPTPQTNFKNKVNINKLKLPSISNPSTNNNSSKNNNSPIKNDPIYENVLILNSGGNQNKTPTNNSHANRPLPPTPNNQNKLSTTSNSSTSGLKKRPAYNPNKGPAPQPPTMSKKPTSNNPQKQEHIYDDIANDPIYQNTNGNKNNNLTLKSPQKNEPIYETPDPVYQNTNGNKNNSTPEPIYEEINDPIYNNGLHLTRSPLSPSNGNLYEKI